MAKELDQPHVVTKNLWRELRRFTDARIGQGRAGVSQTTSTHLNFQLDHARARDAIHVPLDLEALDSEIQEFGLATLTCSSKASDRAVYLQRPDLGRQLASQSNEQLVEWQRNHDSDVDAVIVIADGLSSKAVQSHAAPVTKLICERLKQQGLSLGPICLVRQGRVAIGDEIGALLECQLLILLIGERPGLSSPDSLGIYYTYEPNVGKTDADRNCISNIRPSGMSYELAADKLVWLINESRRRRLSGVMLKDESGEVVSINDKPVSPG